MLDVSEEQEDILVESKPKAFFIIYKKEPKPGGAGEGLKRKRYHEELDFTYHPCFQNYKFHAVPV